MKFHTLYVSSVSACFELENANPYYAESAYDVTVNGAPALMGERTNVFSLFNLEPGKSYCVAVGEDSVTITTLTETACISVRDFGAVGDGVADDTAAIQNAISCCPTGGRVLVPQGTYYVRPLVLKSHMTLELQKGALLLADTCEEHYPILPGEIRDARTGNELQVSSWEGDPFPCRLYEMEVSESVYQTVKKLLEESVEKKNTYQYSKLGVVLCLLRIPFRRKYHYFCSQFVAEILRDAEVTKLKKHVTLYHPGDFGKMPGMQLHFQGNLRGMLGHCGLE